MVTAPPRAPTPYPTVYQLCTLFVYLFLINDTPSTCLVWRTTSLLANKIPSFFYIAEAWKRQPFWVEYSRIGHYRGVARGGSRGARDPPFERYSGHLGDRRKWLSWRDGRYGEVERIYDNFLGSTKYFFEFMFTVFHIIMVIQSYNVQCIMYTDKIHKRLRLSLESKTWRNGQGSQHSL